ncbi:MAG: hypothetical protein JST54_02120 [Deltaproteobacteria bacterium]|nr:hypothetical protein [Deltaproteobacteria bacterium]
MSSSGRHHLAFVMAGAIAGICAQLLVAGPERLGAMIGLTAGLASGFISLAWVGTAAQKSINAALMAVVGGFLIRILLVPAALLGCKAAGGSTVTCAVGFFVLYAVGQVLEILLVGARARQEKRA